MRVCEGGGTCVYVCVWDNVCMKSKPDDWQYDLFRNLTHTFIMAFSHFTGVFFIGQGSNVNWPYRVVPTQNQQTRELISTQKAAHKHSNLGGVYVQLLSLYNYSHARWELP